MAAQTQSAIFRLPFDFLQNVLAQLETEDYTSFLALRSTCRICRQQSEVFLYRDLRLRGEGDKIEQRLLRRLGDQRDHFAVRVQKLILELKDTDCLGQLLEVLQSGRLQRLRIIVWKTPLEMPEIFLSFIESRSNIQLHVINNARQGLPMQKSLLASPSLHRLDYTICTTWSFVPPRGMFTEFLAFQNVLARACNLRSLSLNATLCSMETILPDFRIVEQNMHSTSEDRCLTPEDLILGNSWDDYLPLHLYGDMWVQSMDLSQLRHLDLGSGTQGKLIVALTGRISQLTSLSFGIMKTQPSMVPCIHPTPRSLDTRHVAEVQPFLQSIIALERVTFWSATCEILSSPQTRQLLLEHHGSSLKSFDLRYKCLTPNLETLNFEPWDPDQLQQLLQNASDLEELKVTALVCQRQADRVAHWQYIKPTWSQKTWKWFERRQRDLEAHRLLRYVLHRRAPQASVEEPLLSLYQIPHYYWKNLFNVLFSPFQNHQTVFKFRSLRVLTLCIHLTRGTGLWYQSATRHSPIGPHDENERFARCTAETLFGQFGSDAAIEVVTLELTMDNPEKITWSYNARRKWVGERSEYCIVVEGSETRPKMLEAECEEI